MGWLIAIGCIILVCMIPIGVYVLYNADGIQVSLTLGFLRFTVYPGRKSRETKKSKEQKDNTGSKTSTHTGGKITDFLPIVNLVLDFLKDFKRKLIVKRLEFQLILTDADPCNLAINYGRACGVLSGLIVLLEQSFRIHRRDTQVICDFTGSETLIVARLDLAIRIGTALRLAGWHGFRIIKEYFAILNRRKGGAKV